MFIYYRLMELITRQKRFTIRTIFVKLTDVLVEDMAKGRAFKREFVVVEKLKGEVVQSFIGQPSTVLQSFGEGLAQIHKYNENYIGSPSRNFKVSLEEFNQHLKDVMAELVSKFYFDQERIIQALLCFFDFVVINN